MISDCVRKDILGRSGGNYNQPRGHHQGLPGSAAQAFAEKVSVPQCAVWCEWKIMEGET